MPNFEVLGDNKGEVFTQIGRYAGGNVASKYDRRAIVKRYKDSYKVVIGIGPTNRKQMRASIEFTVEEGIEFADALYEACERAEDRRKELDG